MQSFVRVLIPRLLSLSKELLIDVLRFPELLPRHQMILLHITLSDNGYVYLNPATEHLGRKWYMRMHLALISLKKCKVPVLVTGASLLASLSASLSANMSASMSASLSARLSASRPFQSRRQWRALASSSSRCAHPVVHHLSCKPSFDIATSMNTV